MVALAVPTPLVLGQPGPAWAAAAVEPLHAVRCGPLPGDPALEAPGYAQEDGASGGKDGWWCQLPHATQVPANFTAFRRTVSPLPHTYADYGTEYVPRGTGNLAAAQAHGPTITVSADVNSTVTPPVHLRYPSEGGGRKVSLGSGVQGTMTAADGIVTVSWRFPTKGAPKYLRAVVGVTVTGTHVPGTTVVAVARQVRPD